jgi:nicotinamidase/pyrazinamidase
MKKVLLVVDVQNDFVEGGTLACKGGISLAKKIYDYYLSHKNEYDNVFLSRDWHIDAKEHFDKWPAHCVADTKGAEFVSPIDKINGVIISKGQYDDGYSAFSYKNSYKNSYTNSYKNSCKNDDGLKQLISSDTQEIDICGIATDYCVKETALDALKYFKKVNLLSNLCVGVDNKTSNEALKTLKNAGVSIRRCMRKKRSQLTKIVSFAKSL